MSRTEERNGTSVTRYWSGDETRYEVYKGNEQLSNLRREDVEALIDLLKAALADEGQEGTKR